MCVITKCVKPRGHITELTAQISKLDHIFGIRMGSKSMPLVIIFKKTISSSNHIYIYASADLTCQINKTIQNFILFLVMKVLIHYRSTLNAGVLILMHPDQLFPVIKEQQEGVRW